MNTSLSRQCGRLPGILLWVQTGKLRQEQAVALRDGLFGRSCCQVTLKGQDLLFLSLGDLQLPVDHLCLCVLIRNGARRVCVIATKPKRRVCYYNVITIKLFNSY